MLGMARDRLVQLDSNNTKVRSAGSPFPLIPSPFYVSTPYSAHSVLQVCVAKTLRLTPASARDRLAQLHKNNKMRSASWEVYGLLHDVPPGTQEGKDVGEVPCGKWHAAMPYSPALLRRRRGAEGCECRSGHDQDQAHHPVRGLAPLRPTSFLLHVVLHRCTINYTSCTL